MVKTAERNSPVKRTFTRRKKLEQDLEHVTQEMYLKNLELVETNQTLSLLRAIDTIVLESQDSLGELSDQIGQAIVANSNFPLVTIFAKLPGSSDLVLVGRSTVVSEVHTVKNMLSKPRLETHHKWYRTKQKSADIHLGAATNTEMLSLGLSTKITETLCEGLSIKALHMIKLEVRKTLVGVMVVGFNDAYQVLPDRDKNLLERLSEAVGVAVDSKLLFEENQRVLKQLQRTNKKLRALDEAKDEFISMASHQLRTPLTSIKGYLSMILDGDMGKITAKQSSAVKEAYGSSQRMVFLIADFLNVSRIKTGKFLIEPKEVYLPEIVREEIIQLREMADSRDLKLIYEQPEAFPRVMLDDNKIRQVMMNMVDNAIYYTPSGGTITIQLYNTAQDIIFKVVDTGIGVPKDEQHKLFTKFYRAGNARKSRPDGTGLGLFMAQKIVVEQGGAIIFESVEGEGSTFGFRFPIAKVKVK